ncbi:QueT transporter family protein [Carnobacteriaceae bacterium zg-ZUI240]|nr:QueT transporter family protein [Carnobacteriaceae bacterium zg-ZUI240]
MQKNLTKQIVLALVAAIYVAMTVLVAPISYGPLQFRISETLNHLMAYNKKYIVSLGVGVFLANTTSPFGWIDMLFGTLATLLCCVISIVAFKKIKNELARLAFNIFNFTVIGMLPIALIIFFVDNSANTSAWAIYFSLLPSQFVIMSIGSVAMYIINKTIHLNDIV